MDIAFCMKWQAQVIEKRNASAIIAFIVHIVSEMKIFSIRDSRGACNNFK